MTDASLFTHVQGRFWRACTLGKEETLLSPAAAPTGRWHHVGQKALYLSGTPDGCRIALNVYLQKDDPPRAIFPLDVSAQNVVDLRRPEIRATLRTTLKDMHANWAKQHALHKTPDTWPISDQLRQLGACAILTPSRSRPDLTHLTAFQWNINDMICIKRPEGGDGSPVEF